MTNSITSAGLNLIKKFEGFQSRAYKFPGENFYTIGYGTTKIGGEPVKPDIVITESRATELLLDYIEESLSYIKLNNWHDLSSNQQDAILSFVYNLGPTAFNGSTLRRVIEENPNNLKEIELQFLRWTKAGGKELSGLVKRRKAEAELYMTNQINLTDAAKYYKELPHQIKAFEFLQRSVGTNDLNRFADIYRNEGPKQRLPLVGRIMRRIQELEINLYNNGRNGYGITIVGVQGMNSDGSLNNNELDKWNDIVLAIKKFKDSSVVEAVGPFVCTTDPGKYYTKIRTLNPLGAARVKMDAKHDSVWKLGWHKDQPNCLIQTGNTITVIRDTDKDGISDANEQEQTGWFGINFHHNKGNYNPQSIGRWSAGCLCMPNVQQHQAIVEAFKASKQSAVSYILLDGSKIK